MSKAISEIFNVDPTPPSGNTVLDNLMKNVEPSDLTPVIIDPETSSKIEEDDVKLAQDNLKGLMKAVSESLYDAIEIARTSESPRAYEVVTGMINASADLSTKLIESHNQKQKLRTGRGEKNNGAQVTNNNLFVGTPAELAKLLKGQNGSI